MQQRDENKKVIEVFCNKCGVSCKGHDGNMNGWISARIVGGYDSTHVQDGDVYDFDLCERCTMELIQTFKLWALQGNYMDPDYGKYNGKDRHEFYPEGQQFLTDLSPEDLDKIKQSLKDSHEEWFKELSKDDLVQFLYEMEYEADDYKGDKQEVIDQLRAELKYRRETFEMNRKPIGALDPKLN